MKMAKNQYAILDHLCLVNIDLHATVTVGVE